MDLVTPSLGLIFWQALTFLIVVIVFSRFAWKPILSAIKEREDGIEASLNMAKQARAEMEQMQSANQELLAQARAERDAMMREAQVTANAIVADAQEKARTEGARLMDDARATITQEKNKALADIRNQVAELSLSIAEKVIRKDLADNGQQALIGRYLDEANQTLN